MRSQIVGASVSNANKENFPKSDPFSESIAVSKLMEMKLRNFLHD